jgi:hypothetical protein
MADAYLQGVLVWCIASDETLTKGVGRNFSLNAWVSGSQGLGFIYNCWHVKSASLNSCNTSVIAALIEFCRQLVDDNQVLKVNPH